MATQLYSLPQFFGMKRGVADNLVGFGYSKEAQNVDVTDGALQSLVGSVSYPSKVLSDADDPTSAIPMPSIPGLLWVDDSTAVAYFVGDGVIYEVSSSSAVAYPAATLTATESHTLESVAWARVYRTRINGDPVAILLPDSYTVLRPYPTYNPKCPVVIDKDLHVRAFGSGLFLTSDEITEVVTGQNSVITGVKIGRAMTEDEVARCKYAGVYIMDSEDEELDYTAAYVSDVQVTGSVTTITFRTSLTAASVSVGDWVKVRGGLSNKPVTVMTEFGGRLFAAGEDTALSDHSNRLYWSCLPGDGRTIEDWSADDASPDTGGGYVDVGDSFPITALFVAGSQLLIWKGEELWRLYGTTPSQYTLECVFRGNHGTVGLRAHDFVADVNGVPYWANDLGLWYYNGNSPVRVDVDRTFVTFVKYDRDGAFRCADYGEDLFGALSGIRKCVYQDGSLYILTGVKSFWAGPEYETTESTLCVFNLADGSMNVIASDRAKVIDLTPTLRGILYALLEKQSTGVTYGSWFLLLRGMNTESSRAVLDTEEGYHWEDVLHALGVIDWSLQTAEARGDNTGITPLAVDTVWESDDLSFGASSYHKRLRRIGFDVTGAVRVIVKNAEGGVWQTDLSPTDIRARRLEWLSVDMPYESSFRIRFESVNGLPFRIHSGVDFYIEINTRN